MSAIGMLIYNWFPKWWKMFRLHDDVIKWKHFPRNWPFVRGIHRSPVNSPHKGQWRGALMFSLICVWINDWVNNRKAGDLRRYRCHYDVIVMYIIHMQQFNHTWDNKNASFHSYLCGKGWYNVISLQWRHNGRDGVSNHQPHDCLLNRLLRRRSKRTWKLRATGLCVGNSPVTSEFSAQMASNAENISIWWRHSVMFFNSTSPICTVSVNTLDLTTDCKQPYLKYFPLI